MNLQKLYSWASQAALIVIVPAALLFSQNLPTAKSIAAEMGAGWNLGNTMELIGVQPIPTKTLFDSIKAAGFRTVRIPAAWSMHADQTTHIIEPDSGWLRLKRSWIAIQDSLFVVLNIHWDNGWLEGKIDSAATKPALLSNMKARQGAYWKQISSTFRNYDHHLIFASANEPGVDKQENLNILMSIHQIFIDTVRSTGGNNASRTLILQGPSTSFEHTADWVTTLPKDVITDRIMVEAHFYPYQFCLMSQPADWGAPFYYWGKANHSTTDANHNSTWGEESYVDSQFNLMKPKYLDKNIPVLVGEFGALKRLTLTDNNLKLAILSRRHFYNYVVKAALSRGMIPVAWDAGGKGDGTMTIFDRAKDKEGAIYDLGLLNAIRDGAGLQKLPGDTAADYRVAAGDNSVRILYSAKDSCRGQVQLAVARGNMTTCDSVLLRVYLKGGSRYDSAGITKNGQLTLSLVTMSKNWTWREKSLGALTLDDWKTYSIPVSSNQADTNTALVPADPAAIDFLALQAYSKAFHGAIYVDWIVFKSKNGQSDTVYNFNQKAPEEGKDNVVAVNLFPTKDVPSDSEWETATTSIWGSISVKGKVTAGPGNSGLQIAALNRIIRVSCNNDRAKPAIAKLIDLQGRTIWSQPILNLAGTIELRIPCQIRGPVLVQIHEASGNTAGRLISLY